MKKGEFYQMRLVDGERTAKKVSGYIDDKMHIGIWSDTRAEWFVVDLVTGLSALVGFYVTSRKEAESRIAEAQMNVNAYKEREPKMYYNCKKALEDGINIIKGKDSDAK